MGSVVVAIDTRNLLLPAQLLSFAMWCEEQPQQEQRQAPAGPQVKPMLGRPVFGSRNVILYRPQGSATLGPIRGL
jgi:hypothetical protein